MISEHEFISNIISRYTKNTNDDVYYDGKLLYKIDGFQLSYSFNFMTFYDLGWKAVISSVSDVISRGGIPKTFLVSIGIPKDKISKLEELVQGVSDAIDYYTGIYAGGDLNSSDGSGWIDVSIIGEAICYKPPKINEDGLLLITSPIGYTSLIFLSYLKSWSIKLPEKAKGKIRHPIVNKQLPEFIKNYCDEIYYSTDVSDGLLISLYNIMERSGKGIRIYNFPIADEVMEVSKEYSISLMDLIKYGGEEFETIFIVKKSQADKIIDELKNLGYNPIIFGEIINEKKIVYKDRKVEKSGWDNFLGWF
ncbi:MAG: AIR synthase related protein [Sulfolobus sp.]